MPSEAIGPDRLPPQNLDAERSVLGSMLRDNDVIDVVTQIVNAESFYLDAHRKIFQAISDLHDKGGQPVDLVILHEELNKRGQVEDVGRAAYLAVLWDAAPTAANAEYYARIVRDKGIIRNLIHASTEILRDSYEQSQPAEELLEGAERKILDVAQMGVTGQTITLEEAIHETYLRIDARAKGEQKAGGLSTGFIDLNEITAGLHDGELIIVAARPSVGKTAFSLGIVRNVIVDEREPVFFVSLEQSRIELAERLLCAQARVDSHRLRKGTLSSDDMDRLIDAGGVLRNAKLFIDDSPVQSMLRIAANARRLKLRHGIKLIVVDYLQLIEPDNRRDPRQEQVAQISRRLKALAKELQIPLVALAQVNRSSEDRQDHRPRLADLRESGCLTGETLVTLADTGERVPIRDLVGKSGFQVWALDEVTMKLKPAVVSNAFATGRKPVFRMTTRLGRTIRATANHKFRAFAGWRRLDELCLGDRIALPRVIPGGATATMTQAEAALLGHLIGDGCTLPRHSIQYTTREEDLAQTVASLACEVFGDRVQPRIQRERQWFQVYLRASERLTHSKRNAIAAWLDGLGVFGLRSWEKFVPQAMFGQPEETIATFLRHLWATDGCVQMRRKHVIYPQIYYASSSERLARDVQSLLLRLGINATLRIISQGKKGRPQFHVWVMSHGAISPFIKRVKAIGTYKTNALADCFAWTQTSHRKPNYDIIPCDVWTCDVVRAIEDKGLDSQELQERMKEAGLGRLCSSRNVSREKLARFEQAIGGDSRLAALAESEIYWDSIISLEYAGQEEVFDLTVPGPNNFIGNDIIAHNSIEQDADTVMLLHRPDRYEPGQHEGIIEVIIGKQRNGPTGEITLAYLKQYMRYEDYAPGTPFDS